MKRRAAPATDPPGHPACEEVYEKIIREHLGAPPLDGVSEGEFAREVARRFRRAPMALCSRAIGGWINRKLRGANWSQQDLADRLGVDRSAVAYWVRGGNITLDNLAQVLIEFQSQWADLPIPVRQEMAVAAYLAALTFIREKLGGPPARPLDREGFWCLYHLFAEPHWARAQRLRDPALLEEEAARVAGAVERSLGLKPANAVSVPFLQRLVAEWGAAWLVCVLKVPRRWPTR
jgi:transcriptional regulator with XRE-family HTH domain